MTMKKINIEVIIPTDLSYEALLDVFNRGILNTKLSDGKDIVELEMVQVIDSTKCLVITSKKVCTEKDSCDKMDSPITNGENHEETGSETSSTICS